MLGMGRVPNGAPPCPTNQFDTLQSEKAVALHLRRLVALDTGCYVRACHISCSFWEILMSVDFKELYNAARELLHV
jgi:hypothetical protein